MTSKGKVWGCCGAILAFAISIFVICLFPKEPEVQTSATVIGLGMTPSRRAPGMITVVARTADGRIGEATVALSRLRCRVGDSVSARSVGVSLHIDPTSCVRPRGG